VIELSITQLVVGCRQDDDPSMHRTNLLDAMYPDPSVHNAAMVHGFGVDPLTARLVDTTTVRGATLAAMDLDPFLTGVLDRMR
jgi:hypothetical protein